MNQGFGVGKFQPGAQQRPGGFGGGAPAQQPGGFGGQRQTPAQQPQRPLPRQSRWSGLGDGSQRLPMLEVGLYRLRIGRCEVKIKPKGAPNAGRETFHASVEVVLAGEGSHSPVGMVANVMAMLSTDAGTAEAFRLIRSSAGYNNEEEFYSVFPADNGTADAFFDAVVGQSTVASPIEGRLVDVQVAQGKEDGKGSYYRDYRWQPVPEEEQDQTRKPGA